MNSVSIGKNKITVSQVDKILSGKNVDKVMTLWDKIKDFFNVGDKKKVLTLLYDVYYNPEITLFDKFDKFKELSKLSVKDLYNSFSIRIEEGIFYFEIDAIGYSYEDTRKLISIDIDQSEDYEQYLYKNQSIKSLYAKLPEDHVNILTKIVENKINENKNKSDEEKIDLLRADLLLLVKDDNFRENAIDSFKIKNSPLNQLTSKKVCYGMTPKEAMDKIWRIIKENCNETHNDSDLSILIKSIFDDKASITYETINNYLNLAEIINQERKILDVDFTDKKVTFYLSDENHRRIISNDYINNPSSIKKEFNLELAAFEQILNNRTNEYYYNKSILDKDISDLNEFLIAYSVLSKNLNNKDKAILFLEMLNLKRKKPALREKIEIIKSISNEYNNNNINKKIDIYINKEKNIEFKIQTSEEEKDNTLELNSFFTIPYDDKNLDLLNIDLFNNKKLSTNYKIKILSKLDYYHKNMTILKNVYYHGFNGLSELKEELAKIKGFHLISKEDLDIFNISSSEKNLIEKMPKSLIHHSINDINKIFEYYQHLCFIKEKNSIDDKNLDVLIANGSKRKEKIDNEFTEELYNDINSKKPEELKILKNKFKDNKLEFEYNDQLFSKIINSTSDVGKICIYTLLSENFFFDRLAEKFYKSGEINNTPYLLDFETKKDNATNEEIIKIKISKKREKDVLISSILSNNSLFVSPADFLSKKLENAKPGNNKKSPINSTVLSNEIEITVKINKKIKNKPVIEISGSHNQIRM